VDGHFQVREGQAERGGTRICRGSRDRARVRKTNRGRRVEKVGTGLE